MKARLKKLEEQVLVITGATSGIGLATAKMAASRGARVVLASRDKADLRHAVSEIEEAGGEATFVVADVADPRQVKDIAEAALDDFGGFDTWINNAGVSMYGRLEDVPVEDARRLFDTNYWGVVNGCTAAVPHLRRRGGALINIGSALSDRAIPLQGHYCASKHAVKGYTDALRMELEEEGAPISVTLVKPSAIDTPYTEHARNYMDVEPMNPPPVYATEVVAETILKCAEKPVRDIFVGSGGRLLAGMGTLAPRLTDRYMEATMFDQQRSDEPAQARPRDTLYRPRQGDVDEEGSYPGHVMQSSVYTRAALRPSLTKLGLGALGVGLAVAVGTEMLRKPGSGTDGSAE